MSDAEALARQLRDGRLLTPTRRTKLVVCALLAAAGCLLMVVAADDPVWFVFGAIAAATGAVFTALVGLGWSAERRIWLAREGVVFETAQVRHHVPWDAISGVKLVGVSALARVQLTVRDVEEVAATVRRKRRGGRLRAQARIRRTYALNYWAGKCHVEFMARGLGVDAAALHAVLAGCVADAGSRAGYRALPVPEDTSG